MLFIFQVLMAKRYNISWKSKQVPYANWWWYCVTTNHTRSSSRNKRLIKGQDIYAPLKCYSIAKNCANWLAFDSDLLLSIEQIPYCYYNLFITLVCLFCTNARVNWHCCCSFWGLTLFGINFLLRTTFWPFIPSVFILTYTPVPSLHVISIFKIMERLHGDTTFVHIWPIRNTIKFSFFFVEFI